jgi:hypothetical protein
LNFSSHRATGSTPFLTCSKRSNATTPPHHSALVSTQKTEKEKEKVKRGTQNYSISISISNQQRKTRTKNSLFFFFFFNTLHRKITLQSLHIS